MLQSNRIHGFVPGICADNLETKFNVGKVCIIKNFTVQDYKTDDKFRCIRKDFQLIFSNETQIKEIEDTGKTLPQNVFDFIDHSELQQMTKQNTYLAGSH